ncbi:MAG: hypothetical protein ACRDJJ_08760 [Actinomycetota bacterium]
MRKVALLLACGLALGSLPAPASAAPYRMSRDRSDNTFYFEYDAKDGSMPVQTSATVLKRRDRVRFYLYVRRRPGAEEGKRLAGVIRLRLAADRPVRYSGTFVVKVKEAEGPLVLKRSRARRLTLRPRPGHRSARIVVRFDLESGDYEAFARFRPL